MSSANAMGSGVVVLTTSADGLASGLDKAHTDLESWGKKASATLFSPVGMGLAAGTAIGGTLVAGFEIATKRLDELAKINKRADVLGVSASDLQGMDKLFAKVGVEASDVTTIFAKMGKNILTSTAAAEQFASMGINLSRLASADFSTQFRMIADGINKLPKGAQQATAALEIFGKSGANLLPMLQRGSAGIDEFIAHQRKIGGILSDEQLAAAGRASKAWKLAKEEISSAWDGLKNQLAVVSAPLIEALGKNAKPFLEDFLVPAAKRVSDLADGFVRTTAAMVEMNKEANATGGLGQGSTFWDKFPAMKEVGPSLKSMHTMQLDAWARAFEEIEHARDMAGYRLGLTKEKPILKPMGWDKTNDFLDKFNKQAAPVLPEFGGLFNRIGELSHEIQRSKGYWDRLNFQFADFGDVFQKTFMEVPQVAKLVGIGKMISGLVPGLNNAIESVWTDPRRGAGSWAGIVPKMSHPEFAGAVERGSREAYSIEMQYKYGNQGPKDNGDKLVGIKKAVEKLEVRVGDLLSKIVGKVEEVESF